MIQESYPKIESVKPLEDFKLLIHFKNGVAKIYDCTTLLTNPAFYLLRNKSFFRAVQVDQGGYGIFWNDDLDLSESELWLHGETVETTEEMERTGFSE